MHQTLLWRTARSKEATPMSSNPYFCPHCGAPQLPGATRCRACDQLLAAPAAPSPGRHAADDSSAVAPFVIPAIIPPLAEAWPVMWTLIGLCATGMIAAFALGSEDLGYALSLPGLTVLLTLLILWAAGRTNVRQALAFLGSGRPLVRWVYTPEEWRRVRSYAYEEMRSDQPPLGCLAILFGAAGLLSGLLIGADDGLGSALLGAVIGGLIGAVIGGVLILPVRLINHLAAERILHAEVPATVALGARELFYERIYFDGRVHHLTSVRLLQDAPPRLLIDHYAPRYSIVRAFPTVILVPPRMLPFVQEALSRLEVQGQTADTDTVDDDDS
jgi:ribosomal protein L40E